jgi:hypothetical protein
MTTAAMIGVRRQIRAFAKDREDYCHNDSVDPFARHIKGAMAELAVARTFNLFWAGCTGRVDESDVGGLIEVRGRQVGGSGLDLGIKSRFLKPDKPYVLVHYDLPFFTLVGWIYGHQAKAIGKKNSQLGVYFVPPTLPPLHELGELFDLVEVGRAAMLKDWRRQHDERERTTSPPIGIFVHRAG